MEDLYPAKLSKLECRVATIKSKPTKNCVHTAHVKHSNFHTLPPASLYLLHQHPTVVGFREEFTTNQSNQSKDMTPQTDLTNHVLYYVHSLYN